MTKKEPQEKFERFTIEKELIDIPTVDFDDVLRSKQPIIFDTNFLFVTFEFRIDVIRQLTRLVANHYNLYIYEGTIDELKGIEMKKDKNKKYLPLIMKMLKLYNFKIVKSNIKHIDDQIINDLNKQVIIATNDKELRHRIWDEGGRCLYMRQKAYLEIK